MKFFSKIALLNLLFQIVVSYSHGQYYFKHYQVDDGLVHNAVTAVLQDSKGFIWIGTRGGVNRFDGYSFKTFKNNNDKFGSLGNDVINSIVEDKNRMIWIGTGKGLFKYDPYKETLTQLESAPKEYTNNIVIDKDNNLWFLIQFSLYKYIQAENRIEHLKIQASCIALDSNMNLWMGDNDGNISIYNSQKKRGPRIRIVNKSLPSNARSISKIYPVSNNEFLIGCFKQGLKIYSLQSGAVRSLPLGDHEYKDTYVRDITIANDGKYWIATESGIYINDLKTNTSINLRKRIGDKYALGDNAVYAICRDNQGGMWAGTFFGGLNYYSKDNARFEKYYPIPGVNSISGNAVREICSDSSGQLWIGTEDAGLSKLDLKTGIFTNYNTTEKKVVFLIPIYTAF
ncbi:ligand-binding sensor domain-containing protein [Niabella ginsengisoli]|uniref:Hybrid sensor histidine kinase/response regulator n=1 Tax=Niabella ginsengisoli TaxID=522298 RepID=A0ABS9SDK4_9BACT|nr:two-component regulator propeller domain-containing protein [Niabella ginsengisoli]MCH5596432.1 hypothetical protein [Niabella ginsengisoli]